MDKIDLDEVVTPLTDESGTPLKTWRLKYQAGTFQHNDLIDFFEKEAPKYFQHKYEYEKDATKPSLKINFKEAEAKEGIIDVQLEFILGSNSKTMLEALLRECNMGTVCGKVFKNGEPTYSCRECGMDPTCVLCVSCFKKSAHRYHKYKMSTSSGGGCCDCGDEEAWKRDHYCEEHLNGKENATQETLITEEIEERCKLAFEAILEFCVKFLHVETNASLKCLDGDVKDAFCTVLYNDESHTFDQVISTLTKIVKCRQKDATEIVTSIDREGRAVVKFDTFAECCSLKEAIERNSHSTNAVLPHNRSNQSLRVSVLHMNAVACQQFSLQLLIWLQEFLMRHRTFRQIFTRVIMEKNTKYCIQTIFRSDVKLWKTARTCFHRLLISGLLMEYDNKMALAIEFSRNYANIVHDFIQDDHEHSYSIASLSVQLFTVPSISHYLIANESIFHKLAHIFYHPSIEEHIRNKTLHFTKNISTLGTLKRATYILSDMKYILRFKPDVWTDELRDGFLEGCKALLRLLNVMQGMEAVTRQTDQHIDYEPEWESAFNLHIKLSSIISQVLEWCATDRDVLLKFYQMIMRYLHNNAFIVNESLLMEVQVGNHIANCLTYDVSAQPVSIHLPLSRIFAGVYLHLGAHGLGFDDALSTLKRTPEELMEPILCTQTMIAQVNAGMWRRNGYSLLHQLYFYRNVRCRTEMLDRDIVGMQIGAALIESNQYLIHLLNKFHLIKWIKPDYEEKLSSTATDDDFQRQLAMIDEFLELLIVVISERFVPGIANVTEEDRVKKEIMQLLCIKPYPHSELNRQLPDSNNDTILEDVIDSVAIFNKPQKIGAKGVYELREELFDDYNMYFYHYTKEEKSKSEETQCLRRKNKGQLVCCPPPKLPKLTDAFVTIANLLQCDVMLNVISTVIDRALDLKARSFQENHLQKVLYLIGFGLQEEQSGNYPFLTFCACAQKLKLFAKLEELSRSSRVEAHRDFIVWILNKYKEMQSVPETTSSDGDAMQSEDSTSNAAGEAESDDVSKLKQEQRAQLAAERRAKILAQMQSAQKSFMKSNAEMFSSSNAVAQSNDANAMEWQEQNCEEGAVGYNSVACLGVDRRLPKDDPEDQKFVCILCSEECTMTKEGPTLVYSAFVQKSKVLPPEGGNAASVYTSSCGHVMHLDCWRDYSIIEDAKEQRRVHRNRWWPTTVMHNVDLQCPYCRCLSNTVLPLTLPLAKYSPPTVIHTGDEVFPFDLWIAVMQKFDEELNKVRENEDADMWYEIPDWDTMLGTLMGVDVAQFERVAQTIKKPELSQSWTNFAQQFINTLRPCMPEASTNDTEPLRWMWQSCAYTVRALEVYLRTIEKPFKNDLSIRHKSCLSGLIRASCLHAANLSDTDERSLSPHVIQLLDAVFKQKGDSVLEWQCFSMMVSMILMVPNFFFFTARAAARKSVVANGSMMDFYTLKLFFLANLVKAIVLFKPPSSDRMDVDEEYEQEVKGMPQKLQHNIIEFYRKYNFEYRRCSTATTETTTTTTAMTDNNNAATTTTAAAAAAAAEQPATSDEQEVNMIAAGAAATDGSSSGGGDNDAYTIAALFEHVKMEMREFLRCCCLFFHFVTDVEFPDEFTTADGDTFENMCKYLGLSSQLEVYFDNASCDATVMESFASHPDIVNCDLSAMKKRNGDDFQLVPCIRPIPQLVPLPDDYSDLINSVSDFICPHNDREEMKSPTMCLVCGEILCGQSYCCQPELYGTTVGACTYHVHFCGAEIGPFLRIRDCHVVYLGRNKGGFMLPPYLDEYGETDQGLRRGNPLHLCHERYRKIHLTWLSHGLHEEIARMNDVNSPPMPQWYHM